MPYGIGVESKADMLSEKDAIYLLHEALGKGINFFDTARMYGDSENIMGKAFEGRRAEVVLATKCRHFRIDGQLLPDDQLRLFIEKSVQESLNALRTDYLDVFMLHQADLEILDNPIVAEVFDDLRKKGIIRATGSSTYTIDETQRALETGNWDVIQLPFNLLDQRQASCFHRAYKKGVGVVVRSVLLKGLLSDKGKNLHIALADVENHIRNYEALMELNVEDLPTAATRFALSFDEVSSVLVGIDKLEYLYKALQIANGKYMSPERLKEAQKLAYPDPNFLNLPYWDRMGWLK